MQKIRKSKKIQIIYTLMVAASSLFSQNLIINKTIISKDSVNVGNSGIIIDGKKIRQNYKPIPIKNRKIVSKKIPCDLEKVSIFLPSFKIDLINSKKCFISLPKFLKKEIKHKNGEINIYDNRDFDYKISLSCSSLDYELNGDYDLKIKRDFKNLHISSTADGKIEIDSKVDNLKLNLTGDFQIEAKQNIKNLTIQYTGDIELKAKNINLFTLKGVGDANIRAKKIQNFKKDVTGDAQIELF